MNSISQNKRSKIMKAVKPSGNKTTELALIQLFRKYKITGWRRNFKLKGKPDFVFPKERIVVFADGCFWHGHNCRNTTPKTNEIFWQEKIINNKKRDISVSEYLELRGWQVIRIWECDIQKKILPIELLCLSKSKLKI
jgi:DNA mismatch endonuclease (patch repair protein)